MKASPNKLALEDLVLTHVRAKGYHEQFMNASAQLLQAETEYGKDSEQASNAKTRLAAARRTAINMIRVFESNGWELLPKKKRAERQPEAARLDKRGRPVVVKVAPTPAKPAELPIPRPFEPLLNSGQREVLNALNQLRETMIQRVSNRSELVGQLHRLGMVWHDIFPHIPKAARP